MQDVRDYAAKLREVKSRDGRQQRDGFREKDSQLYLPVADAMGEPLPRT